MTETFIPSGYPPVRRCLASIPVPDFATLLAFGSASLVLLLIPGPAVTYIVSRSLVDGRATAMAAVVGVEVGNFLHVVAATVGLSAVLATSATAFATVKWLGVTYLLVVGMRTLVTTPDDLTIEPTHASFRRAMTQGIVINALNPKVALFFLSFLPQFVNEQTGTPALQTFLLGVVFVLLGCVTDSLYALAASGARSRLMRGRGSVFVRRYISGFTYLLLGIAASTAVRPR